MAAFKVERATRASRVFAALLIVGVVVLATLPYWGGSGNMRLISECGLLSHAGEPLEPARRLCGPRVGRAAGLLSALAATHLFLSLEPARRYTPLLALGLAAPVCALLSLPMALAVFRLRGAYFAVGTWVLGGDAPAWRELG